MEEMQEQNAAVLREADRQIIERDNLKIPMRLKIKNTQLTKVIKLLDLNKIIQILKIIPEE